MTIQLRADNLVLADRYGHTGTSVDIDFSDDPLTEQARLNFEIKNFFGWRHATKKYDTVFQRYSALGSHDHDRFIQHMLDTSPNQVIMAHRTAYLPPAQKS